MTNKTPIAHKHDLFIPPGFSNPDTEEAGSPKTDGYTPAFAAVDNTITSSERQMRSFTRSSVVAQDVLESLL